MRLKLVSVWLPVLIVCREKNVSPIPSGQKQLYQELEETFLRIISTLPMSDAELLLHHCLSFATRNVEDCPHLVSAFNTWFRRATFPPQDWRKSIHWIFYVETSDTGLLWCQIETQLLTSLWTDKICAYCNFLLLFIFCYLCIQITSCSGVWKNNGFLCIWYPLFHLSVTEYQIIAEWFVPSMFCKVCIHNLSCKL